MRPALFDVLLWTSTWGSLLNSIPAEDTHLPSDTGFPSSPCGEHWQGMGRERGERGTGILSSSTAIAGFPPHPPRRATGLQDGYSFPCSSAGALEMAARQQRGQRALQTTRWPLTSEPGNQPPVGSLIPARWSPCRG